MARKNNLAEVLQTEVTGSMPLKTLAKVLASKGRRGDTMLAHITPKEAKKLKKMGGSGTINPETGLPEFFGEEDFTTSFEPVDVPQPPTTFTQEQGPTYSDLGISSGGQTYGPEISAAPAGVSTSGYQSPDIALSNYTGTPLEGSRYDAGFGPAYNYAPYVATAGGQEYGPAAPVASPEAIQSQIAAAGGAVSPTGAQTTDIGAPATKAADTSGKTEEEKSSIEKLLTGKNLLGLGIAGAGGLMGYLNQQKAAEQAKNAAAQIQAAYAQAAQSQKDLAQPLIGPGYTALAQAQQGALSPANQQALQAAQARAAQASARSGGVGAVQTAIQEEAFRQQLLSQQQQQALALLAPGNAMLQAAINAQLQGTTQSLSTRLGLEQQANQAAMGLYSALGSAIGGGILKSA
jgi:hypothetical protein